MTTQTKSSRALHVSLWILQLLMALMFIWLGAMKLFSLSKLSVMMPWMATYPGLARTTGFFELLGALGLVLPSLLRTRPQLTTLAAIGLTFMAVAGAVFHITRGEASLIGVNIICALITSFIAWGRSGKTAAQ
ncbi:MAG TPA: DoxX family protein [Chitinophaga sp.]